MMPAGVTEFVYKLPGTSAGSRPGAHRSRSRGSGMAFASHARLFDRPDPRRLDLRASLTDLRRDWLVRTNLQRSSVAIHAIVDVSASMHFGSARTKIAVTADFLGALGYSAHRYGDSVSLLAFDHELRDDLYIPARTGRGIGLAMADALRHCTAQKAKPGNIQGLGECVKRIAGCRGLVFLISDFHWPLAELSALLDNLSDALVVPLVVWDKAEVNPPSQGQLLSVCDLESGQFRRVWLRKKTRRQWLEAVQQRRVELGGLFAACDIHPFHMESAFDAEALSRYFMEKVA